MDMFLVLVLFFLSRRWGCVVAAYWGLPLRSGLAWHSAFVRGSPGRRPSAAAAVTFVLMPVVFVQCVLVLVLSCSASWCSSCCTFWPQGWHPQGRAAAAAGKRRHNSSEQSGGENLPPGLPLSKLYLNFLNIVHMLPQGWPAQRPRPPQRKYIATCIDLALVLLVVPLRSGGWPRLLAARVALRRPRISPRG